MTSSQTRASAFEPMGILIRRYHEGDEEVSLEVHLEDGEIDLLFGSDLFRTHGFTESDELALATARGRTLDVGAAAGCHSLDLQARGIGVWALDSEPLSAQTQRDRGVENVIEKDFFELTIEHDRQRFDTILFLMNGFGIAGDLAGLERLLLHCHDLLESDGILIADLSDLTISPDPAEANRIASRRDQGRYAGEAILHLEIESTDGRVVGDPFPWLYVDPETLSKIAEPTGWRCQVLFDDGDGDFLVQLQRS